MPTCWHWAGLVTPGTVATLLARSRHMEWLTAGQQDSWIEGEAGPAHRASCQHYPDSMMHYDADM